MLFCLYVSSCILTSLALPTVQLAIGLGKGLVTLVVLPTQPLYFAHFLVCVEPLCCPRQAFMSQKVTRKRLEWSKYIIYVSVPLVFGFVLGRIPGFWESMHTLHPSAASNPRGPYLPKELTESRPTLHTEFQLLQLERAVDAALAAAKANNHEKSAAKSSSSPS